MVGLQQSSHFTALPVWARIADLLLRHSVPIFVLISGYKYQLSVQNHPERSYWDYLYIRIRRLGLPYLIWTAFYYFTRPLLLPSLTKVDPVFHNYPIPSLTTAWNMLAGFKPPAYQFWFLGMLFLTNLAYPVLRKILKWAWLRIPVFFWLFLGLPHYVDIEYARLFQFFAFYEIGCLLCNFSKHPEFDRYMRKLLCLSVCFLFLTTYIKLIHSQFFHIHGTYDEIQRLLVALMLFSAFALLGRVWAFSVLPDLGRMTWPIYILHDPILLFYTSIYVYRFAGLQHQWLFLVTGTLTLLECILVHRLIRLLRLNQILF